MQVSPSVDPELASVLDPSLFSTDVIDFKSDSNQDAIPRQITTTCAGSASAELTKAIHSSTLRAIAHRVVAVSEIMGIICHELRKEEAYGTLLAVCRLRKSCKDSALDALWHTLPSFRPVEGLLSFDLASRGYGIIDVLCSVVQSSHPTFCPPPVGIDRDVVKRLLTYTARVRELTILPFIPLPNYMTHDDGPMEYFRRLIEALRRACYVSQQVLFPRLHALQIQGHHLDLPARLAALAGQRLSSIEILDIPPTREITREYLQSIPLVFETWTTATSKITRLHASIHVYPRDFELNPIDYFDPESDEQDHPWEVEMRRRYKYQSRLELLLPTSLLSSHTLTDVRVPPWSSTVMETLSGLPQLKTLALDIFAPVDQGFRMTFLSGTEGPLAPLHPTPFQPLQSLHIKLFDPESNLTATAIVRLYRCIPRDCFSIWSDVETLGPPVTKLLEAVAKAAPASNISTVKLELYGKPRLLRGEPVTQFPFSLLRPLLNLTKLGEVDIRLNDSMKLVLVDSDSKDMSVSWPHVRAVHLH